MNGKKYEFVERSFKSEAEIPKDKNIFYRRVDCGNAIPSVPRKNIGCECGNIFIDKDYWRLVVADLCKLEVIKKADE